MERKAMLDFTTYEDYDNEEQSSNNDLQSEGGPFSDLNVSRDYSHSGTFSTSPDSVT
jgi:hypothetical protein